MIPTNQANQNQFDQHEAKPSVISMEREMPSTFMTEATASAVSTGSKTAKVNIQDEFIEEEQTDSDVDPSKPDAQKRKKKIYRCKRCNKLCNSKNALHYHFLSHTGERPHQCNECGKSFFASSALKVISGLEYEIYKKNCLRICLFHLFRCTSVYTAETSLITVNFVIGRSGNGAI